MHGQSWGRIHDDPIKQWRHEVEQLFHALFQQQFAWVRDLGPPCDETQVRVLSLLDDTVNIRLSTQIIRKPGRFLCPKRKVQPGGSQVPIDQQYPPLGLPYDRLRQVGGDKSLPLRWHGARYHQLPQRFRTRNLVKSRSQRSKSLRAEICLILAFKHTHSRIDLPLRTHTSLDELFVAMAANVLSGIKLLRIGLK